MLDFIFIILIFLEIAIVYYIILKVTTFEKKVIELNKRLIITGQEINKIHIELQQTVRKVNKVVRIFTNKKFIHAKKVITVVIDIIQIVMLLQSFNLSMGLRFNLKNIKKLFLTGAVRGLVAKIFQRLC